MNTKRIIAYAALISLSVILITPEQGNQESFIAAPKAKKLSDRDLKNEIGSALMHNTQKSNQLLQLLTQLQGLLLNDGQTLIAQEKGSFFVTANSQELKNYHAIQHDITKKMASLEQSLRESINALHTTHAKKQPHSHNHTLPHAT